MVNAIVLAKQCELADDANSPLSLSTDMIVLDSTPRPDSVLNSLFGKFFTATTNANTNLVTRVNDEMAMYLKSSILGLNENPLVWWHTNGIDFQYS